MTKLFAIPLLLASLACACLARANEALPETVPGPSSQPAAAQALIPVGKNAVGLSALSNASDTPPIALLSYRRCLSERWSIEGMAGFNAQTTDSLFRNSAGNPLFNQTWFYEEGLGVKYNWKRPVDFVLVQLLASAAFKQKSGLAWAADYSSTPVTYHSSITTNYINSVNLGLGFEAFIPFWPSLSVEGSIGLGFTQTATWDANSNYYVNTFGTGTYGLSLVPLAGAVHYYY